MPISYQNKFTQVFILYQYLRFMSPNRQQQPQQFQNIFLHVHISLENYLFKVLFPLILVVSSV